jgi:UPF0755 protein
MVQTGMERRPGGFRRFIAGVLSAAFTLAVLGVVVLVATAVAYEGPGPKARQGASTTVILRRGGGLAEMASSLARAGAIRAPQLFIAAAELSGGARKLKAGEYNFPSRASLAEVLHKIRIGDVVHHRITIPEGVPAIQVAQILNDSDVLTGEIPTPAEGSVLPETYEVVRGDTRASVLQKMMDARDRVLADLWSQRKPGLPFATPEQAVTLASIVEKETAVPAERPRIAAVYINRLRSNMKLQADPTVIYGVTSGAPLGRGLRESELTTPTPYNTYVNFGLPPGPIGNPGRAALAAVMDPPDTDELYFVADGAGGHVFSRSYDDQVRNVARWRAIEKKNAIVNTALPQPPVPTSKGRR